VYGVGILKGLAVTFKNALRPPFTVQYPEQRVPLAARFRGYNFAWYREKCTVCCTCAKSCPVGIIYIVGRAQPNNTYYAERFEIDTGRCLFCGLCVESCPFEAIYMGREFEQSQYARREEWIDWAKKDGDPRVPSAWFRPCEETGVETHYLQPEQRKVNL